MSASSLTASAYAIHQCSEIPMTALKVRAISLGFQNESMVPAITLALLTKRQALR
jgi:hypothetical protein